MESKLLEKKIGDWAVGLGFSLPCGSSPASTDFSLLTATPHRRQLWETIIESVQSRKNVEHMRKQILVSKLRLKTTKRHKQILDNIDSWGKQNLLETQVQETRNFIDKQEKCITERASDSLFEICKLGELEKLCDEYKEKILVLRLFSRKWKKLLEELKELVSKITTFSNEKDFSECRGFINKIESKLLTEKKHHCALNKQLAQLCCSKITQQCFWEEVIKCKEVLLEQIYCFLMMLNSNEQADLSNLKQGENDMISSVRHLKQRTTENSLGMIMKEVNRKLLVRETKELLEKAETLFLHDPAEEGLKNIDYFSVTNDLSGSYAEKEANSMKLRIYVKYVGLKTYHESLRNEMTKLQDECDDNVDTTPGKEEFQGTLKSMKTVMDEIRQIRVENQKLDEEITKHYEVLQALLITVGGEIIKESRRIMLEDLMGRLKAGPMRQASLFIEAPVDSFKLADTTSNRMVFECESLAHCLNPYRGEFKHFFSRAIIFPVGNAENILKEVEKRRKCTEILWKFRTERERLFSVQRKLLDQLASLKCDSQSWNFNDSNEILCGILFKSDEMTRNVDFIEKVLKNWVEQPYRLLITENESFNDKTLKEYEEKVTKENQCRR